MGVPGADSRIPLPTRLGLYLVATVLFLAGIDKILHYSGFVNALRSYSVVPVGWADFLALPVIGLELAIAVAMLLPATRVAAATGAAILLVIFSAALAFDLWFGNKEICGCWFSLTVAPGGWHLFQNLVLIALATTGCHELTRDRRSRHSGFVTPSGSENPPYPKEAKHEESA